MSLLQEIEQHGLADCEYNRKLLGNQTMKTLDEIKERAHAIAMMHYYADVDDLTAWEPFEGYSDEWIAEEIENMTDMLTRNMLWAQENV